MRKTELIVFDLGGTIIEDRGEVPQAFKAALISNGLEVSADDLLRVRGLSKRDAIRMLIKTPSGGATSGNEDHVERIYIDFRDELRRLFRENGVIPIPGAEDLFPWLRKQGLKIAITTGFDRITANLILKQVSWDKGMFDATICSDEVSQGRPAPFMIFRAMELTGTLDVHRVIKVGDTPFDILAGNNAGVHSVGTLTGPHDAESLKRSDPTCLIPSIVDVPTLLVGEG
jgi:phosphonatase-like hydrolase